MEAQESALARIPTSIAGSLEVGQILIAGGRDYRIRDEAGKSPEKGRYFHLEQIATGARKAVWECDLRDAIASGLCERDGPRKHLATSPLDQQESQIISVLPSDMYSEVARRSMLLKLRMIRALRDRGVCDFRNLDELALEMRQVLSASKRTSVGTDRFEGFSFRPSTIRDAAARLKATGNPRCLLPNFHLRGGVNKVRTEALAEDFVEICLNEAQEQFGPLRISDVFGAASLHVSQWNRLNPERQTTMPSYQTVSRRFHKKFSAFYIVTRNRGKAYAKRHFRENGARVPAMLPLDEWQMDDTDGEVFLVCEKLQLPWGRPHVTACIDAAVLAVPGYEISEQARSVWSAISCLSNGILQSDMSRAEFAESKFPMVGEGVPGIVTMDNASYNFSPSLEAAISDLHCIPGWTKPGEPTNKSQIEHWNHIFKTEFTPFLPGWRGPKKYRDGLKDGPHSALLDLSLYRTCFAKWLTDVYSNTPRAGGLTPRQNWEGHFALCKPLIPPSTEAMRLVATLRETHTFRDSGGLLRMGLRYGSEGLIQLRKRLGAKAKVQTRIHPYDLSKMYVYDPILKHFLIVPCLELADYTDGLTNYQQKLIRKRCAELKKRNPSFLDMVQARNELRELVNQASRSKKLTERRTARRANMSASTVLTPQEPEIIVVTDLENSVMTLDSVVLDPSEDPGYAIPTAEF